MKKNRKGISPVLGAVLMITITLALAGVAFVWIRNTVEKTGKEQNDILCREVNYAVGDLRCYNVGGNFLKFNAVNYAQDLKLMGFMVTIEAKGESRSFNSVPAEIDSLMSGDVSIDIDGLLSNINRIRIIPRVKSGQEIVNCEEKETIMVWSEIEGC
ncbi:MAG: type IV pilin [Nanoarchaeota archaeon]|nr:type IV pilin [Nanoarchaeota archaeon]